MVWGGLAAVLFEGTSIHVSGLLNGSISRLLGITQGILVFADKSCYCCCCCCWFARYVHHLEEIVVVVVVVVVLM